MTHDIIQRMDEEERFLAYLDGEFAPAEKKALEDELASNPELRVRFDQYKRTVELLGRIGPTKAPESFLNDVQTRVARRPIARPTPQIRFPFELVAVMAVLLGVLYMYFVWAPGDPGTILRASPPSIVRIELNHPLETDEIRGLGLESYGRASDGRRIYTTQCTTDSLAAWLKKRPEALIEPQNLLATPGRVKVLIVVPAKVEGSSKQPEGMRPQEKIETGTGVPVSNEPP